MKVVINRRFGGFGLSPIATAAYYKKKGITATFYQPDGYDFRKSHRVRPENITGIMCYAFSKDLGEILNEWPEENGISLSCSDMPRDDADLVTTVEELGKLANTRFSFLEIVEIPDGVSWGISEYDGMETIEEAHRSWC